MSRVTCPFCLAVSKDDYQEVSVYTPGLTYRDQVRLGEVWLCPDCGAVLIDLDNTQLPLSDRSGYCVEKISGWFVPGSEFRPDNVLRRGLLVCAHWLLDDLGDLARALRRLLPDTTRRDDVLRVRQQLAASEQRAGGIDAALLRAHRLLSWVRDEYLSLREPGLSGNLDPDADVRLREIAAEVGESDLSFLPNAAHGERFPGVE